MISSIHDPRRGWTKGMPSWEFLEGTSRQLDPTRCKHYVKPFIATIVDLGVSGYRPHSIIHRFRCKDCGRVFDIPRDVKSAGRSGAIEIEDPRVFKTLQMDDAMMERFHHNDVYDGRYAGKTFRGGFDGGRP
jgi:hypothetical protein